MSGSANDFPLWLAWVSLCEEATRDWLTGLYNRRFFEETLTVHIKAAIRYERELSLILFDIDQFKQINDTRGHQAGDAVLRNVGQLLKSTARAADIICRYGGDEFAAILPETGKSDAERLAERALRRLENAGGYDFSATAGIAALPSKNLAADADTDLLVRKKSRPSTSPLASTHG